MTRITRNAMIFDVLVPCVESLDLILPALSQNFCVESATKLIAAATPQDRPGGTGTAGVTWAQVAGPQNFGFKFI